MSDQTEESLANNAPTLSRLDWRGRLPIIVAGLLGLGVVAGRLTVYPGEVKSKQSWVISIWAETYGSLPSSDYKGIMFGLFAAMAAIMAIGSLGLVLLSAQAEVLPEEMSIEPEALADAL